MKNSLVSIVVPCYNGEPYLERFFESILKQTYKNLELIFINDGSEDRTEIITLDYKEQFMKEKIKFVYKYQKNVGQAAALMHGLKLCSGEYLSWVDVDDEIVPQYIETKVKYLEENTLCEYCCGKALEIEEENHKKILKIHEGRKKTGVHAFFEDILFCQDVFFSGYMVRIKTLDKIILKREIYSGRGGQNAQILLPFAWYYGDPGYVEESVYKYYIHADSHSHCLNTSQKIIQQLDKYEEILIATIKKIKDESALRYIPIVEKYYAKIKFGNAIDTKDVQLIKKQYEEVKKAKGNSIKITLLYLKYTNKWVKSLRQIKNKGSGQNI